MARAETTPGRFVGMVGFEWSHGLDLDQGKLINHVNVFGTPRVFPKLETSTLEGFWCHLLGLPDGADKPVIIGEFHFGALDRGMFHPGLKQERDQPHRAELYRSYVQSALAHPLIIGTHWFQ